MYLRHFFDFRVLKDGRGGCPPPAAKPRLVGQARHSACYGTRRDALAHSSNRPTASTKAAPTKSSDRTTARFPAMPASRSVAGNHRKSRATVQEA